MGHTQSNLIISAADETYYRSFLQLYHSYLKTGEYENSRIVFFDLGMNEDQVQNLKMLQKQSANFITYQKFDFKKYPSFVGLEHKTYSWKPILIQEIFSQHNGSILWLDSANILLKNLKPVWDEIAETGSYVPFSGSGTLKEWTVQETLDYLNVPENWYKKRNRAGNTCGFSTFNNVIADVIERWKDLSLVKECIKPDGANRSNHRDDQSLLTILLLEAAEKHNLQLTHDEVDISSYNPNPYISVRNFVSPAIPIALNPVTILFFKMRRRIDMLINRIF